ncbi:MAG: murein biosynthesis integral membrane protein MurJ [Actinomycetes bacterium]
MTDPDSPQAADATAVNSEVGEALRELEPGDLSANPPSAMGRTVARASTLMAAGTVVSRVTGVGRDIAMTAALGFFIVSDAYSLGNSLPTVVYILVIGGALNAVFVPQLVRRMKEDTDGGKAYADRLITLVATVLLVMSIVAVVAAPWIVSLYTTDTFPAGEYDLAVAFARLCLPQVFFYGLYTLLSQVLNSRGRFGMPMFAPIANNVVAIATFLLFIGIAGTSAASHGQLTTSQVLILGIGTTLGVIAQAVILIPVMWKSGYAWRPRFDWRGAGLGKAGTLAFWTIGLVLVNQATYVVITRLATQANVNAATAGVAAAGLTTYQKAHLVFLLPHSVITVSVVTAMLPALSRVAHDGRLDQVGRDIAKTMRTVAALIVPVAMVLIINGASVAILLFGYGAATTDQAGLMGLIVSVFMIGLLPFTLFYVLLRGYYALEDTRTPFFITIAFSVVLLITVLPLFSWARDGGRQVAAIALAYSLSYWVGFVITWIVLARRLGSMRSGPTVWGLTRIVIAGLISLSVMGLALLFLVNVLGGYHPAHKGELLIIVIVTSVVGLLTYVVAALALRVPEVAQVKDQARGVMHRVVHR